MVMEGGDAESCCSSRASAETVATLAVGNRKRLPKVEVFQEVLRRLRESECEEVCEPNFEDELWSHFNRLPVRYALDVNVERAQEVLMHKRLLHMAHDPATRPAFEARLLQPHSNDDENDVDSTTSYTRMKDAQISIHPGRQSSNLLPAFGSSSNLEFALEFSKLQGGDKDMSANQHLFR